MIQDHPSRLGKGFSGVFKRGMKGVYSDCGEQHMHRYLNEFAFRRNNRVKQGLHDAMRAALALRAIGG